MLETLIGQSRLSLEVMKQEVAAFADVTDRATAESDRHLTLIMRERDRQIIDEIHEALARVKEGEYGICQECGEEIGVARLRAQPTATLCVHCKTMAKPRVLKRQKSCHANFIICFSMLLVRMGRKVQNRARNSPETDK